LIDIHSHILSEIDDGAKDMETTINMLKLAERFNTTAIIATPHYYQGYFENAYDEVANKVDILKSEIKNYGINIEIYTGQEILLDSHTVELFKSGIIRGLNGSRYILLELPMDRYSVKLIEIIYELRLLGVMPIIAHPERYYYIQNDMGIINDFIEEGCLFQINAGSITGIFGKLVEKTSRKLIENGVCNFIASDAHTVNRRCPGLEEALRIVEQIDNSVSIEVQINGELLLKNENIKNINNKISIKKSFFGFLK